MDTITRQHLTRAAKRCDTKTDAWGAVAHRTAKILETAFEPVWCRHILDYDNRHLGQSDLYPSTIKHVSHTLKDASQPIECRLDQIQHKLALDTDQLWVRLLELDDTAPHRAETIRVIHNALSTLTHLIDDLCRIIDTTHPNHSNQKERIA